MVRIAHAADIHLGARPYRIVERERDIYDAFKEMVERVIEERADILILSGDIFDHSIPRNSARKNFRDNLKRLREKNIKVLGILGDHDFPKMFDVPSTADIDPEDFFLLDADPPPRSSLKKMSFPVYLDNESDLVITGLCARRYGTKENIIGSLKVAERYLRGHKIKVLLLHQAIKEYWPFDLTAIPRGAIPRDVDYVAMGHIHNRFETTWGKGKLVYPGSIEALRRNEWDENGKGFYIVDLEEGSFEAQFIRLESVRPQIEYRLGEGSLDELIRIVEGMRKEPILHVIIPAGLQGSRYFRLMERLLEAFPPESKRILTMRTHVEGDEQREGATPSPIETISLEEVIEEVAGEDARLIIDLLNLLRTADRDRVKEELERKILEWIDNEGHER